MNIYEKACFWKMSNLAIVEGPGEGVSRGEGIHNTSHLNKQTKIKNISLIFQTFFEPQDAR